MIKGLQRPELPSWAQSPVFVYGPRKGGTTLLQNLLDGGDHLFMLPSEVKLKRFLATFFRPQPGAFNDYFAESTVFERKFIGFDSAQYKESLEWLQVSRIASLRDMMMHDASFIYHAVKNKPDKTKMWGFKDVGGPTIGVLKLFRQMFFNGKIILILRDPRFVTRSVLLDRRRKGIRLRVKSILKQIVDPIRVLSQQLAFQEDPAVHMLCYESLSGGYLTAEMGKICKFLDIPYQDIFQKPTIFGTPVVVSTSSRDTKEVFRNKSQWHDGLTFLERFLVSLVHFGARCFSRGDGGKPFDYERVERRVTNRN